MNEEELVDDIKNELLRTMILNLQQQVGNLKEEIKFMRNEMIHKNKLISIFVGQSIQHVQPSLEKPVNCDNESSVLLQEIMNDNRKNDRKSDMKDRVRRNYADEYTWSSFYNTSASEEHKSLMNYDKSCDGDISSDDDSKLFIPHVNSSTIITSPFLTTYS